MTIFAVPIFDASVVVEGKELFKGKGSAVAWAEKLAAELGSEVVVKKLGAGWALYGTYDSIDCVWGLHGHRLCRIN